MARKINGLSPDLLFHPGETLRELIDDRGMNQKELAVRTGFSEKHISKILSGDYDITARFAFALEHVFEVSATFWINLQANYDLEKMMTDSLMSVTDEERGIIPDLSQVIKYFIENGLMEDVRDRAQKVLMLRKILGVNNLTVIPALSINSSFRVSTNSSINPYILFSWIKICEMNADKSLPGIELNNEKLINELASIRKIMFSKSGEEMYSKLISSLKQSGVQFRIIPHFTGAPVYGFIERLNNGEVLLCLTLRHAYAGIFWFTLFHEISHIINNDIRNRLIEFDGMRTDEEIMADEFAKNTLIESNKWEAYIKKNNFSIQSIKSFAKSVDVPHFIVIERLQKEKLIPYNMYASEKIRYKWN